MDKHPTVEHPTTHSQNLLKTRNLKKDKKAARQKGGTSFIFSRRRAIQLAVCCQRPQLPMHYAILFRGEAYRWGCDTAGVALQHAAVESHLSKIIVPLEARGDLVKVFLAVDHRACKRGFQMMDMAGRKHATRDMSIAARAPPYDTTTVLASNASTTAHQHQQVYSADSTGLRDAIANTLGAHRVEQSTKISNVKDQPDSITKSLRLFRAHASASSFDFLIVTRYDVRLLTPITSWACDRASTRVSAASKCEPGAWARFHCVADHFWIVPQPFVAKFVDRIGTRLNLSHFSSCCFSKRCIQKAGHGCYSVLAHALGGGDRIGFCWPQPAKSIAEPNANYECCRHGRAPVKVLEQEPGLAL